MKVRIIDESHCTANYFTIGNVYDVKDGHIQDNDGAYVFKYESMLDMTEEVPEVPTHFNGATSPFTMDSALRKEYPVFSGLLEYFPDAIAAVAHLSFEGNIKHNAGEPLHWSREKSSDHKDCIARHLIDHDWVELAWRALANLQIELEKEREAKTSDPKQGPDGVGGTSSTNACLATGHRSQSPHSKTQGIHR